MRSGRLQIRASSCGDLGPCRRAERRRTLKGQEGGQHVEPSQSCRRPRTCSLAGGQAVPALRLRNCPTREPVVITKITELMSPLDPGVWSGAAWHWTSLQSLPVAFRACYSSITC